MLEYPKGVVIHKTSYGKEYWWCKENRTEKGQWFRHKPEYHINWSRISSVHGGSTNYSSKGYITKSNKNIALTKAFLFSRTKMMYNPSCPSLTYIIRGNSMPGTESRRLPQHPKRITTVIKPTPTTT